MSDQIRKNEMGGACSTMGVREEVHIRFWWRPEENRPRGRQGIDGMILLKWIWKRWDHVSRNPAYQRLNVAATY
jgi:hypothetical protein